MNNVVPILIYVTSTLAKLCWPEDVDAIKEKELKYTRKLDMNLTYFEFTRQRRTLTDKPKYSWDSYSCIVSMQQSSHTKYFVYGTQPVDTLAVVEWTKRGAAVERGGAERGRCCALGVELVRTKIRETML